MGTLKKARANSLIKNENLVSKKDQEVGFRKDFLPKRVLQYGEGSLCDSFRYSSICRFEQLQKYSIGEIRSGRVLLIIAVDAV